MNHPSKKELENYAARRISAAEMTVVILHLEDCADCSAIVQKISAVDDIALFAGDQAEQFHLDYDEHLRPFVDYEADPATREIVENHTQFCADCAFQLRELREFSESLRLREIEKPRPLSPDFFAKMSGWFRQIAHRRVFQISFLLAMIFLFGAVVFVWLRAENPVPTTVRTDNSTVADQTVQTQTNSDKNDKIIAESANKTPANNFPANQNPPDLTKTQSPENRSNPPLAQNKFAELGNLPENLRAPTETALASEKITFPAFLSVIGGNLKLRGLSTDGNSPVLSPNGEAIREVLPQFKWKSFASADEKYIVEIFDAQNNQVAISPVLSEPAWRPKNVLERGRIYKWEVRAEKSGVLSKTFGGTFKVLEQKDVEEIANISVKSALLRGVVFAGKGLLTDAKNEFRRAVREKDRGALAQKFLRQIESRR